VPRVLMVEPGVARDFPDVEVAVVTDGAAALALLRRERFDSVVLDLSLEPLDGWYVLAAAGSWPERPRLIAFVAGAAEARRARVLGADLCVAAGTELRARALMRSNKEKPWPRPHRTSSRRPTPSGVSG
jgi:CheY-like chemotaxis protein